MRLLVFFDLPTKTKADKKAYVQFRRFLLKDGYDMIQWSVYGRIVSNHDREAKHLSRLKNNLPEKGSVRCLSVTEKQFSEIAILVGTLSTQEKLVSNEQLLLF